MEGSFPIYAPSATAPWRYVPDDKRGTLGMALFITTEAMLFVMFFFSYFYIGHGKPSPWPPVPPDPKLAFVMLAILVGSSFVLAWAEGRQKRGELRAARTGTIITILMGVVFLIVQTVEYSSELLKFTPTTDAHGSAFYTITSFHGAHVTLGLLMLIYALLLPGPAGERTTRPPYRPLHNTAMYWHFVDVVWVFIVMFLYVLPQFQP